MAAVEVDQQTDGCDPERPVLEERDSYLAEIEGIERRERRLTCLCGDLAQRELQPGALQLHFRVQDAGALKLRDHWADSVGWWERARPGDASCATAPRDRA